MKRMLTVLLVVAMLLSLAMPAMAAETGIGVVKTESGMVSGVQGEDHANVTIFKNVPYAAPPVGELRWKAPQDPEPWTGVRACDTFGNIPMQNTWLIESEDGGYLDEFYWEGHPEASEDCLYLSVATPAKAAGEKLPVMLWFHGGGLNQGFYSEIEFDPEELANKGIVVVSVGTRLGPFGYLSLPQLDAESDYGASGNYGLMDSIKALEWVHDNIAAFGGDPDNVTLTGQSGGTAKVTAVLASPKAEGLFDRVILQSGLNADTGYQPKEQVQEYCKTYLENLGLDPNASLAELRAVDATVFVGGDIETEDQYAMFMSKAGGMSMCIDGEYLTRNASELFHGKNGLGDIDILCGINMGEKGSEVALDKEQFDQIMAARYGALDSYDKSAFDALGVTDDTAYMMARIAGNREAIMGDLKYGAEYDDNGNTGNMYVYMFSRDIPGNYQNANWAYHSGELWYMFGSLRLHPDHGFTAWDYELSDAMTSYWSNFVKTGDPNGAGLPTWPTAEDRSYMDLGCWNEQKLAGHTFDALDEILMESSLENRPIMSLPSWMLHPDFSDVAANHPCRAGIDFASSKGYLTEMQDTVFGPDYKMTRGAAVAALGRMLSATEQTVGVYSDVTAGTDYAGYVGWAHNSGIVDGYGTGKFGPKDGTTLEQACLMLSRAAKSEGISLTSGDLSAYQDGGSVAGWAREAVAACAGSGILAGLGDSESNTLSPDQIISRAMFAQMLMNFNSLLAK